MVIKKVNLDIVVGVTSTLPETPFPEVAFAGKSNVCVLPGCDDVLAYDFLFINALISDDLPTFDLPAKNVITAR